jgi:hypothetical protein
VSLHLELPDAFVEQIAARVAELLAERQEGADDGWLDVPEAAAYLSVSRSELYSKCSRRDPAFPVHKEGARSYFRKRELDRYREQNGGPP